MDGERLTGEGRACSKDGACGKGGACAKGGACGKGGVCGKGCMSRTVRDFFPLIRAFNIENCCCC